MLFVLVLATCVASTAPNLRSIIKPYPERPGESCESSGSASRSSKLPRVMLLGFDYQRSRR
ncbi:MAG: hypothetical protein ACI89X_004038, partial [Planctomycetota bacterium]